MKPSIEVARVGIHGAVLQLNGGTVYSAEGDPAPICTEGDPCYRCRVLTAILDRERREAQIEALYGAIDKVRGLDLYSPSDQCIVNGRLRDEIARLEKEAEGA